MSRRPRLIDTWPRWARILVAVVILSDVSALALRLLTGHASGTTGVVSAVLEGVLPVVLLVALFSLPAPPGMPRAEDE